MGLLETAQKRLEQEHKRRSSLAKLRSQKTGLQDRVKEVLQSSSQPPKKRRGHRKGSLLRKALQVLYKEGKIASKAEGQEKDDHTPAKQEASSPSRKISTDSLPPEKTTESLASAIEGLQKVISQFMAPYLNPEVMKELVQNASQEASLRKDSTSLPSSKAPSSTSEQNLLEQSSESLPRSKALSSTSEPNLLEQSSESLPRSKSPSSTSEQNLLEQSSESLPRSISKPYETFVDSLSNLQTEDLRPDQPSTEMEKLALAFDEKLSSLHEKAMQQPFPQKPSYVQQPVSPQGLLSRAENILPPQPVGAAPAFATAQENSPASPTSTSTAAAAPSPSAFPPPSSLPSTEPLSKPVVDDSNSTSADSLAKQEPVKSSTQDFASPLPATEQIPPPVQEIKGTLELKVPELEDSPYLTLTYDFRKIPHDFVLAKDHNILEYAYYRYKPMLVKAQNFIKRKQIAHGLNYYRTITEQQIPTELKIMIEKNIQDINDFLYKYLTTGMDDNF